MAKIIVNNPRQVINGGAKKYYFKVKGLGGPKGDKGDKGDTGATGPEGPQGNAATVSIGSTTTLPVGYDATVTNSGSIYNAVLNFGIPQGPRGPQGATGATGAKGDKGDQGNPGPQGEKGTNATVYVGTTSTLNPGSQATVYNSGTDSNAVLNFGIPKGEKGDPGPMPTIAQSTGQATDQVMSQKATTDALNTKQATITSSNKLSADLVTDTSTTNKFVTAEDKTTWNAKQDALTAGTGIDITSGIISTPAIVPEVVTELPTTGAEGKLYLTPKAHTTSTATGNPIEATITAQAGQLESFQLDGDTFQQSYTGKNLVATTRIAPQTQNGVTCTWGGASFTLNGTSTASTDFYGRGWWSATSDPIALPAGTYTLSMRKSDGSLATDADFSIDFWYGTTHIIGIYRGQSGAGYRTLTLDSDTQYSVIYISLQSGKTYNNEKFYVQLEKSESPTTYEPFVGGQPSPSPDYPQQIQTVTGRQVVNVTGKNRLRQIDGTYSRNGITATVNKGKITLNGTATATAYIPLAASSDYYSLDLSGAYTLSATRIPGVSYTIYHGSASVLYSTSSSQTKTLGGTYDDVRFQINVAQGTTLNNVVVEAQLEKGSTATAYAPYSKQTYPISLGSIELCKIGTYQDYIYKDGSDWKVHKATATITLSGESSENWYIDQYAYMLNSVISAKPFSDIANIEAYCKSFSKSATGQTSSYAVSFWYNATGTGVRFIKDQTPDLSSFRSWLANNNQTVYYPLATATDTTITDTTLITQLEAIRTASLGNGTNTITNTATGTNLAGDMEIGYYGFNPRNRYDKWLWLDINNEYEQIGG